MPTFQPLTGIYEPSGIQQLPDGRFLVVEDEKQHPFSLVTIGAAGRDTEKQKVSSRMVRSVAVCFMAVSFISVLLIRDVHSAGYQR